MACLFTTTELYRNTREGQRGEGGKGEGSEEVDMGGFGQGRDRQAWAPFLSISSPSLHSYPSSLLSFPPDLFILPFLLCCKADPLNTAGSLEERCELPKWGLQQSPPPRNRNRSGETCLVATIFVLFVRTKRNVNKANLACTFSRGGQVPPLGHAMRAPMQAAVVQF